MFRALVLWYIIGLISCNVRFNSTVADSESNGPIVSFSEVITNSDNAVSEAELAAASTQSAGVLDLDSISTKEPSLNARHCPRASSNPCVVKCCPLGESLGFSRLCEPSSLKFEVIFFGGNQSFNSTTDDDLDFIFGNPCMFDRYRLEPRYDSTDEFHVLRNGTLMLPFQVPYTLEPDGYCLEVFLDPDTEEEEVLPLVCFQEVPSQRTQSGLQFILYPIGLLISIPFLIITVFVYCRIPELRNLQGKSLICHVACLIVAYIFLAAVQLGGEELDSKLCVTVAFVIQFSFLACFFWLSVLSINMWLNVRANIRLQRDSKKSSQKSCCCICTKNGVHMTEKNERKFFICYSIYAWCVPAGILVASMVLDLMPVIPSSYLKPNFGDNKCWFSSQDAELHYFYGPVLVVICITILLLAFTALRVHCHHWRTDRPNLRQILRMNFCLFCLTGFNWLMEVVSWFIGGPDYIWYITDFFNTMQGVIIFTIFVLEPDVRSRVWKKWGPELSHISQVMCCSHSPNASAVYSSPEVAKQISK